MKSYLSYGLALLGLIGALCPAYAQLDSKDGGHINNTGTIIVRTNASIAQDTIEGRVEYNNDANNVQSVAQITYRNVAFIGRSMKQLDSDKQLVALDTLITASDIVQISMPAGAEIIANGVVTHNGAINSGHRHGSVRLRGANAQNIDGRGEYKLLELDNLAGADVVNGGGFSVATRLDLTRGEMRNSVDNNFTIGGVGEAASITNIRRTTMASLRVEPLFANNVNVQYTGNGSLTTGGEIPTDGSLLQDFLVDNTGGATLTKSVTVNDSLALHSSVITETDANNAYTLTHASVDNPVYANLDAEVIGSMQRTNLVSGQGTQNVFNNAFTYVSFETAGDKDAVSNMTLRVMPNATPEPQSNENQVRRSYRLTAQDENENELQGGFDATVGYAWRVDPVNEEHSITQRDDLQLQRWDGSQWVNQPGSETPQAHTDGKWIFARAENIIEPGFFAVGLGDVGMVVLVNVQVLLEGPYRNGSMSADLLEGGQIPLTPPNTHPYTLDPARIFNRVNELPDSVVDWIVVEFRTQRAGGDRFFRTGFVKTDGRVVGLDGETPLSIDSGTYYVAVHHRNHLAAITIDEQEIRPGIQSNNFIDFTISANIFGNSAGVKLVEDLVTGRQVFAMIAGDINGDGKVDRLDYDSSPESVWQRRNSEGYIHSDTDMNGIVTTKDANVSWNNRGRESLVP